MDWNNYKLGMVYKVRVKIKVLPHIFVLSSAGFSLEIYFQRYETLSLSTHCYWNAKREARLLSAVGRV